MVTPLLIRLIFNGTSSFAMIFSSFLIPSSILATLTFVVVSMKGLLRGHVRFEGRLIFLYDTICLSIVHSASLEILRGPRSLDHCLGATHVEIRCANWLQNVELLRTTLRMAGTHA